MEGGKKSVNSELWHACAGPRISLPSLGSLVVYFPQGHSEQVAASTLKEVDGHIPNYPSLQSQLVCQLHSITLHADMETDEVFAQMTLQPVSDQEKDLYLPPDIGTPNRQLTEFFCKNLTASDTSTHGGFSIPRRAAEKVFPPLDFTKQPPAQELQARDLHDNVWTFRHIYRGQPKRHLLTTGWSVFVSAKRLVAGDSVLFIRDDKGQLLLGIRRANTRHQSVLPSSLLSSDSMHIGVLAAAAHAAATSSRFQVFYNPRTSPSEFVIPWSKYRKAVHFTQVSVGMRFRMVFETEESNVRRYMGTITGIGDLDSTRWPGSKWRNLEVGWDESSAGERPRRVSPWEIEPLSEPFFICSPPFPFRPKRPYQQGDESDMDENMKQYLSMLRPENDNGRDPATSNMSGESWLYFQRPESVKIENVYDFATCSTSSLQDLRTMDASQAVQRQLSQQGQFMPPQQQGPHVSWPHTNGHQQQVIHPQPLASPTPLQSLIIPHPTFTQTSQTTSSQITSSQSTVPQTSLPPTNSYQTTPLSIPQPSMHVTTTQPTLSHQSANQSYSHSHSQPQLPLTPQVQPRQGLPQIQPKLLHTTHILPSQVTQQILSQGHHQATSTTATQISETPSTHFSQVLQSRNQSMTRPIMKFPESDPQYGENTSSFHGHSRMMLQRGSNNAVVISSKVEDDGQISNPNIMKVNPSMVPLPQLPQSSQQAQQSQQLQPPYPPQLPQLSQAQPQPPFQNIPQIEPHIGNWFHLPRENTQCESPMLSNIQIGQSDTSSSTVTSCSQSLAPESFDNSLILPTTTTSFATRFNNINKEVQCQRAVNDTVMGSFSSPSGSFTPSTPDGSRMSAGMISNAVLDEGLVQRLSHVPVPPPVRTFTKVHKSGSVGRSIDLSRMTNYDELRRELARLFNIEGQLEDPQRSYWQLVFVDTDGDILLVGDDPWDEFVSCVRAIKILSTAQVLQMNQEGLEQLTNALPMLQTSSSSEDFQMWKGLQ